MAQHYPDLASIALFLATVETGSISAAARIHDITQPAATARLRRLERSLGIRLLDRSTVGSSPTVEGATVVIWANDLVRTAEQLMAGATALRSSRQRPPIRITGSYTTAEYLLPQALVELRKSSPDIAISLSVANSSTVIDDVLTGRSELGFIESSSVPKGVKHRAVGTDRLVAVIASEGQHGDHPALDPHELAAHTLVLREHGSGTRDVFLNALHEAGGPNPSSVIEMGSTAAVLQATTAGGVIGIVSELAVRGGHGAPLRPIPTPKLNLERTLRAIWLPKNDALVADAVGAAARAGRALSIR
jgi:DNA-binding transcriptional LysR family regulator